MSTSCRPCWCNCVLEADPEILQIDKMEDAIAPLSSAVLQIRNLISTLEMCHHKAPRWVDNIIAATGTGQTTKGLGTRPTGQVHPTEAVWQNVCIALSAWCAGRPSASVELLIDLAPASRLLESLGQRSPLKEWQVHRVIEKIRNSIHWPRPLSDPAAQYEWLLLDASEGRVGYRDDCPDYYKEHEDYWLATVTTTIDDAVDGEPAVLSLGLAIDMLWPCHWSFVENLQLVLAAIGGDLKPQRPFAACGRNIGFSPLRARMEIVCRTLRSFCGDRQSEDEVDEDILRRLGEPTQAKRWLAASLEKTIRLQLDPPPMMRAMSVLTGPEWLVAP